MTGISDPTGHLAAMDQLMRREAERAKEIQGALEAARSTAVNTQGTVEATVDSTGALTGLTIKPEALETGPAQLAQEIQEVYRAARVDLTAQLLYTGIPLIPGPEPEPE